MNMKISSFEIHRFNLTPLLDLNINFKFIFKYIHIFFSLIALTIALSVYFLGIFAWVLFEQSSYIIIHNK